MPGNSLGRFFLITSSALPGPLPSPGRGKERDGPELSRGCERLVLGDGEHEEKALSAPEVVVADGCIVLLPRRVQNVDLYFFSIENHFLPVTVSFGRFVVFYKLRREAAAAAINKGCREIKSAKK